MKKLLLSGVALMALAMGPAMGADLSRPVYKAPPPVPPPPPPVQDWSGIYVGLEGGYGWATQNIDPAFNFFGGELFTFPIQIPNTFPSPTVSSVNQSGWLAGGFAGAQKQLGIGY